MFSNSNNREPFFVIYDNRPREGKFAHFFSFKTKSGSSHVFTDWFLRLMGYLVCENVKSFEDFKPRVLPLTIVVKALVMYVAYGVYQSNK